MTSRSRPLGSSMRLTKRMHGVPEASMTRKYGAARTASSGAGDTHRIQASLASSACCACAKASPDPGASNAHQVSFPNSNSVRPNPYGETDFRGGPSSEPSFSTSVDFPVCEGPSTVKQRMAFLLCHEHKSPVPTCPRPARSARDGLFFFGDSRQLRSVTPECGNASAV